MFRKRGSRGRGKRKVNPPIGGEFGNDWNYRSAYNSVEIALKKLAIPHEGMPREGLEDYPLAIAFGWIGIVPKGKLTFYESGEDGTPTN